MGFPHRHPRRNHETIDRRAGRWIFLFHASFSSAATRQLKANLTGAQEVPPTGSSGTGTCTVSLDDVTGDFTLSGTFTGLGTAANLAHIHGLSGPGVNSSPIVNLTFTAATSGTLSGSGTLSAANKDGMLAGLTYVNVHTSGFSAGEIRGQLLVVQPAPAFPMWGLVLGAGMLAAAGTTLARRRHSKASHA